VKLLLVPFAILLFVVFLIVLGAIGLAVAYAVIYVFSRPWRLVTRGGGEPSRNPPGRARLRVPSKGGRES
jgi:hypothetical protein